MKNKREVLLLFLFSTFIPNTLASCELTPSNNDSNKTNYYIADLNDEFNEIKESEFLDVFSKQIDIIKKDGFGYDYVGVKIDYKNPIDYYGIEINEDYALARVNQPKYMEISDDSIFYWLCNYAPRYTSNMSNDFLFTTKMLIDSLYNVDEKDTYYEKPYAYVGTSKLGDEEYEIKTVFDDSFLVSSLLIKGMDNEINISFQYFNENDLPGKEGKISQETYQDIAFVSCYKRTSLSKMKVKFIGENMIVSSQSTYDPVLDVYIQEYEEGDVEAKVEFQLTQISFPNDNEPTNKGILTYSKFLDSLDITKGEADDFAKATIENVATTYSCAINQTFFMPLVGANLNDKVKASYFNNPLKVELKTSDVYIQAQFNDFGAIKKCIYEKDGGYTYTLEYSYL